MATEDKRLGTRTIRGMFWAYGSYVVGKLLVLVSVAILARLLTPSEFGLVAFALIVTALLDTVSDLGVSQALIIVKDRDAVQRKADTAWTVAVGLGVLLMVITAALGPVMAAFFDEPALTLMLPLLSVNFLLRALGITHLALTQKEIDFRTRTIAQMADVVTRGLVGIGLALAGAGAYSLIGGYLAGSAAMTISLWALFPWRPSPRVVREDLRGLLGFGGSVTVLNVVSVIVMNADYVAVGKVLGKTQLGLYTLGWRLPELVIVNLSVVAGLVLFPSFAKIERPALAEAYLSSFRYVLMVSVPLTVGLCVLAEPLVLVAFGDQWRDSIAVMQILTLFALAVTLAIPGGIIFKAIDRVDVLIKIAIPEVILAIAAIVIFVEQGIQAVAACQVGAATMVAVLNTLFATRTLEVGWGRTLSSAWPALVGGAALAAVLLLVDAWIEPPLVTLLVAAPLGAITYLGTLWIVAPEALMRLWRTARGRQAPATAEVEPQTPA